MCKYNNYLHYFVYAIFPLLLMIGCAIGGIMAINDSKVLYPIIRCEIVDIIAFDCDYDSRQYKYHTATAMLLQINNTNYTTIMFNNCMSCFTCKNLYSISDVYNCTPTDGVYTIYNHNLTEFEQHRSLVFGTTLMIISAVFAVTLMVILVVPCIHAVKHFSYTEL